MRISDWSSDVCSSDLGPCRTAAGWQVRAQWPCFNSGNVPRAGAKRIKRLIDPRRAAQGGDRAEPAGREALGDQLAGIETARGIQASLDAEFGRAAGRERVGQSGWISEVDGSDKQK